MNTTAVVPLLDANDTLSLSAMNPSDLLLPAEVPQYVPSSETLPIDTEKDQPKVFVLDKKTLPYYLGPWPAWP